MLLSKKNQFFDEIAKEEKRKLYNGCAIFHLSLLESIIQAEDAYVKLALFLIFIGIIIGMILGTVIPFLFFIFSLFTINLDNYVLFILSFINITFFTISMFGFSGKGKCCSLYNPYQWIFIMQLSNSIIILTDIPIIILIMSKEKKGDDFRMLLFFSFFSNIICVIIFGVIQGKIFIKLSFLFENIRIIETNVIKYCVIEYIKELE